MIIIENTKSNLKKLQEIDIVFSVLRKRRPNRCKDDIMKEKEEKLARRKARTPEQNAMIAFKCKKIRYIKSLEYLDRSKFLSKSIAEQKVVLNGL